MTTQTPNPHPIPPGWQSINPLLLMAEMMVKLQPPGSRKLDLERVQRELQVQAELVDIEQLIHLEIMLLGQAQMLHTIFANACDRCAEADTDEKLRLYTGIALKAQNYCRQTITTLAKFKKTNEYNPRSMPFDSKAWNEPPARNPYAAPPSHASYHSTSEAHHAPKTPPQPEPEAPKISPADWAKIWRGERP